MGLSGGWGPGVRGVVDSAIGMRDAGLGTVRCVQPPLKARDDLAALHIAEQRHESEIHVQLLVAVKQGPSWIVGDEVEGKLLKAAQHDDVLDHTGGCLAADVREFKAVAM